MKEKCLKGIRGSRAWEAGEEIGAEKGEVRSEKGSRRVKWKVRVVADEVGYDWIRWNRTGWKRR